MNDSWYDCDIADDYDEAELIRELLSQSTRENKLRDYLKHVQEDEDRRDAAKKKSGNCPRCGGKLVQLLIRTVCETCSYEKED